MRDGAFGETSITTFSRSIYIKEVKCYRLQVWFFIEMIGEVGQQMTIGSGILLPGGVGEVSVLLLHFCCRQVNMLEGGCR